jgi:hypothetical protein
MQTFFAEYVEKNPHLALNEEIQGFAAKYYYAGWKAHRAFKSSIKEY